MQNQSSVGAMNLSKMARALHVTREVLTPFVSAGVIDPGVHSEVERVNKRASELLAMNEFDELGEFGVEALQDFLSQLAYLSSDEMHFKTKWLTVRACAMWLNMHPSTVVKLFESGEIPSFVSIHGRPHSTVHDVVKVIENRKAGIVYQPRPKIETLPAPVPAPIPKKVFVEDEDEAWDANIGKSKPEPKPEPEPELKPQPEPVVDPDDEGYVPPTEEEQAETLKKIKERAKAGYEEMIINQAKERAAALARLSPEEAAAKLAAEEAVRKQRLHEFMTKKRD